MKARQQFYSYLEGQLGKYVWLFLIVIENHKDSAQTCAERAENGVSVQHKAICIYA